MSDLIRIGLAIILHPGQNEVLIARRKKGAHLAEYWEFPGGKIEDGETAAACAVREALEETGLEGVAGSEWEPVVFDYPDRTIELCPVDCRAPSSDAKALESDEIAWVGAGDLDSYTFPPANNTIIAALKVFLRKSS